LCKHTNVVFGIVAAPRSITAPSLLIERCSQFKTASESCLQAAGVLDVDLLKARIPGLAKLAAVFSTAAQELYESRRFQHDCDTSGFVSNGSHGYLGQRWIPSGGRALAMALVALIAAAEAMLFSPSRAKRGQTRRQVLMGDC